MILSGQSKLQDPCTDTPSVGTQCNSLQSDCHVQNAWIYLNFTVISTITILYMWNSSNGLFHSLFLLAYALRIFKLLASNWNECQLWAFQTYSLSIGRWGNKKKKKSINPATFKTMVGHRCPSFILLETMSVSSRNNDLSQKNLSLVSPDVIKWYRGTQ